MDLSCGNAMLRKQFEKTVLNTNLINGTVVITEDSASAFLILMVPTQGDPDSLYVQLSRCWSLEGIMLLSKARERNFVGNKVPDNMVAVEERLELLSKVTILDAESWSWLEVT
jgi:hypothetical protein